VKIFNKPNGVRCALTIELLCDENGIKVKYKRKKIAHRKKEEEERKKIGKSLFLFSPPISLVVYTLILSNIYAHNKTTLRLFESTYDNFPTRGERVLSRNITQ
jgi:hypothetical protein